MRHNQFSNITFFQMQMCLSIVEHGSFSRAAATLHVTQPTLSKKVAELELQLGLILFIRGKNTSVRPTPAGRALFAEWKNIIKAMEVSVEKAYEVQACKDSTITLSLSPSASMEVYFNDLVAEFSEQFPAVTVRVGLYGGAEQRNSLMDGTVDFAFSPFFSERLFGDPQIVTTSVLKGIWYAGMLPSNPAVKLEDFALEDLRTQNFVVPSPHLFPGFYEFIEGICSKQGFTPNISFVTTNHLSIPYNVRHNNEVFLVDGFSSLFQCKLFVFRPLPQVSSSVIMSYNKSNDKPIVGDFLRFSKDFFRAREG